MKAKVTQGTSPNVLYEKDGFCLYVSSHDELRVNVKKRGRLLRRFLRDYVRSQGGSPRSVNFYFSPFK